MKYHRLLLIPFVVATCSLTSSCTSSLLSRGSDIANKDAERSGSPFRWHAEGNRMERRLVDAPVTKTAASPKLRRDILSSIGSVEVQKGGNAMPHLIETRLLSSSGGVVKEVWVIARKADAIAYTVTMTPSHSGGTDFKIQDGFSIAR